MLRLSGSTVACCILSIGWTIAGFADVFAHENYGGIILRFFVAGMFAVVAIYGILCDFCVVKPFKRKTKISYSIVGFLVAVMMFLFCLWNYSIETNKVQIASAKIPEAFNKFKIAQISDLHNAEFDKYNSSVLGPIFHSKPDIIVITGDMIDSRNTDVDVAVSLAQKAVKIAPTYYINGNHESRLPEPYERLKAGLMDAGVIILENETVDIVKGDSKVTLIGINDPTFESQRGESHFENVSNRLSNLIDGNDNYKILLAHKPEFFGAYAGKVDLVFSGHAHGGQFIIPFVGGVIAPGQGFFPEYYQGSHTSDGTEMIVSRGIGNSIIPFRINNRPEIIIAELVATR